ncbi:helix-turn-helix transcriptional regulator [Actinosynnema sp. NPDC059797]
MSQGDTPIVHQRRLRSELRKLREEAQLTQKEVADSLDWSVSKVIRIENGTTNVGTTDLRALLMLYGIDDKGHVEELVAEARASRKTAWWSSYRASIDPQLYAFIGYEASASRIRQYQSLTMPGLLQTSDYTTAMVRAVGGNDETISLGVALRGKRQEIVAEGGPELRFLLHEAILRERLGGVEVMAAQLYRILEKMDLENVSVRVLPYAVDKGKGWKGSFSILDIPVSGGEQILVLEEPVRDVLIRDNESSISEYDSDFERLWGLAHDDDETASFIRERIDDLNA